MLLVINRKEPKFKLDNDADSGGTCLQGHVELVPRRLVEKFGYPSESDSYKSSGEYTFRGEDGEVWTLYDWKSTTLYAPDGIHPDELWASDEVFEFHVGGNAPASDFIDWLKHTVKYDQSPETRGGCDRYYHRAYNPHYLLDIGVPANAPKGWIGHASTKVGQADMTAEEIAQYKKGWLEETERKDWGRMDDDSVDEDSMDEFNREGEDE